MPEFLAFCPNIFETGGAAAPPRPPGSYAYDNTVLVHTSVEPSSRQPTASSSVRQIVTVASLFERGLRYDGINTAKSAISAITEPKHGLTLGSQPLISRFMKGVFRSRPPVPRYEATSDVQVVLSHLASFAPVKKKHLDLKSVTYTLDLQLIKTGTDMVEFAFPTHIKQSRTGYKNPSLQLKAYPADPGLCVVTHLREYIAKTQELRGPESKLLISCRV